MDAPTESVSHLKNSPAATVFSISFSWMLKWLKTFGCVFGVFRVIRSYKYMEPWETSRICKLGTVFTDRWETRYSFSLFSFFHFATMNSAEQGNYRVHFTLHFIILPMVSIIFMDLFNRPRMVSTVTCYSLLPPGRRHLVPLCSLNFTDIALKSPLWTCSTLTSVQLDCDRANGDEDYRHPNIMFRTT